MDLTLTIRPLASGSSLATFVHTFTVSEPFVSLVANGVPVENISYTLPDTLAGFSFTGAYGIQQFQTQGGRPSVRVYVRDINGVPIDAPVHISAKNTVKPCVLVTRPTQSPLPAYTGVYNQTSCVQIAQTIIPTTGLDIFLKNTMVAGHDTLVVTIPGTGSLGIPVTFHPATISSCTVQTAKTVAAFDQQIQYSVVAKDMW